MGIFGFFAGIVSSIGGWLAMAAASVVSLGKMVLGWGSTVSAVTSAFLQGRDVLIKEIPPMQPMISPRRPDLDGGMGGKNLVALEVEIATSKTKLKALSDQNNEEHNLLRIRVDVLELVIAAATVERFAGNLRIHFANLQTHFEVLRNMVGLVDNLNRTNLGVRAVIQQWNRLIKQLHGKKIVDDTVELIEGIDLQQRPGAISLSRQFKSFNDTKDAVLQEGRSFIAYMDDLEARAHELSKKASSWNRDEIVSWLEVSARPSLKQAKLKTNQILEAVRVIPVIEESGTICLLADADDNSLLAPNTAGMIQPAADARYELENKNHTPRPTTRRKQFPNSRFIKRNPQG